MKCFAFLAATTFAVTSAQQSCDSLKLISIVGGANGLACSASTGYTPASLKLPEGDVLKKVCSDTNCKTVLQEITAAVPAECTFNGVQIKSLLIDKFPTACSAALGTAMNSNATSSNSTASSNGTTATPTPTPTTSMATTMSPSAMPNATQETGSTSGGSSTGEDTEANSASRPGSGSSNPGGSQSPSASTVPAPESTKSASAVQLSALVGVVVATAVTAMIL